MSEETHMDVETAKRIYEGGEYIYELKKKIHRETIEEIKREAATEIFEELEKHGIQETGTYTTFLDDYILTKQNFGVKLTAKESEFLEEALR